MSLSYSQGKKEEVAERFSNVFRQIIFLIIPISLLMFLLRAQIVRIILGKGQFGWVDTQLTAACLGMFSIGIAAYGLSLLINKTFYTFHNTKIPALITLITIGLNIFLSYFFIWILSFENFFQKNLISFLDLQGIEENLVIGLPLALAISGIFQCLILTLIIYKKLESLDIKELIIFGLKILIASGLLVIVSLISIRFSANFVDMQKFWGVFLQTIISSAIGLAVYGGVSLAFGLKEFQAIKKLIIRN